MGQTTSEPSAYAYEQSLRASDDIIGFDKASRLLLVGGGCLLVVLIFGIILCRLDISAGNKRRANTFQQVEN